MRISSTAQRSIRGAQQINRGALGNIVSRCALSVLAFDTFVTRKTASDDFTANLDKLGFNPFHFESLKNFHDHFVRVALSARASVYGKDFHDIVALVKS